MLENTWFEEQLVKTTQKLVCTDLHSQLVSSLNGAKKGIRLSGTVCSTCNKPLKNSSILVFFCGHPLHKSCFTDHQCPICNTIGVDKVCEKLCFFSYVILICKKCNCVSGEFIIYSLAVLDV